MPGFFATVHDFFANYCCYCCETEPDEAADIYLSPRRPAIISTSPTPPVFTVDIPQLPEPAITHPPRRPLPPSPPSPPRRAANPAQPLTPPTAAPLPPLRTPPRRRENVRRALATVEAFEETILAGIKETMLEISILHPRRGEMYELMARAMRFVEIDVDRWLVFDEQSSTAVDADLGRIERAATELASEWMEMVNSMDADGPWEYKSVVNRPVGGADVEVASEDDGPFGDGPFGDGSFESVSLGGLADDLSVDDGAEGTGRSDVAPADDTPADGSLVEDPPVEDVEDVEDVPVEDVLVDDVPVDDAPAHDTAADEAPVEDAPADADKSPKASTGASTVEPADPVPVSKDA